MIPKIIHYCWFSPEFTEEAKRCIDGWHQLMPDYQFKHWNADNFDVNSVPYVKEAFEAGKFAFAADYIRLFALYTEGGIYLDCDIEAFKSFDDILHYHAFAGFEGSKHRPLMGAMMASEAGGVWVKEQLDEYEGLHFLKEDGSYDMMTNTVRITERMVKDGFITNGKEQTYKDLHVFPTDYFCPRQTTGEYFKTENTYCDHLGACGWGNSKKRNWLLRLAGPKISIWLVKLKRKLFG